MIFGYWWNGSGALLVGNPTSPFGLRGVETIAYDPERGYIDAAKIKRFVPDVKERDVYLCGPAPMMKAVRSALQNLGVPNRQIHWERFSL